jgi:molybdopterin converting factor small subunit
MNVDVWFHGGFRGIASRRRQVSLPQGATLNDLIEQLTQEYGSRFSDQIAHRDDYFITLNGNYCTPSVNEDRPLDDKDVVAFVPITVGG